MADNITLPIATKEVSSFHHQKVMVTDSAGVILDTFGGGTQYAEDAAHTSGDTGTLSLAVRRDTGSTMVSADGDYSPLQVDANGALRVTGAGGGTQYVEDVASVGGETMTLAGAVRRDAAASSSGTDGDYSTLNVSSTGRLWCSTTIDAALPAGANNIGDVDVLTVPTDPFGANADAASSTGSISAKLRFIAATGIPITGTVAVTDNSGSLTVDAPVGTPVFVRLSDGTSAIATLPISMAAALPAGSNAIGKLAANSGVTIGAVEIAASQTLATLTTCSTLTTLTGGGVAHDGADSGNPVKVGAKAIATSATATMVSAGDRVDVTADIDSAVLTRAQFPLGDLISERVTNTDGNSTAFSNFGAATSTRSVITAIVAYNSSATAGTIDFRDGTGGSVLYTLPIPAGGGCVLPAGATPYFRTSANTALAYDVSGALSTVTISITGFKSKV